MLTVNRTISNSTNVVLVNTNNGSANLPELTPYVIDSMSICSKSDLTLTISIIKTDPSGVAFTVINQYPLLTKKTLFYNNFILNSGYSLSVTVTGGIADINIDYER